MRGLGRPRGLWGAKLIRNAILLGGGVLLALSPACRPGGGTTIPAEDCTNGVDDDGNGSVDCADLACGSRPECIGVSSCGNGVRDGDEFCDGSAVGGQTCVTQGFLAGTLGCAADCEGFDTSQCIRGDRCGDGMVQRPEGCDGTNFDGKSCRSEGFDAGTLACSAECMLDTSGCTGTDPCGNNSVDDPAELCDGTDLDGETCETRGFVGGTLGCQSDCAAFDESQCMEDRCGNGVVDPGEACDGLAFPTGTNCASQGFVSGALGCGSGCMTLDTAGCSLCGNDSIDGSEVCDGSDLGAATCQSRGYQSGTLACRSDCGGFVETGCAGFSACGNGALDGLEICDASATGRARDYFVLTGTRFFGPSCSPYYGGTTLVCNAQCQLDVECGLGQSSDFCALEGLYEVDDGAFCDGCKRWTGFEDGDCTTTTCGDGVADGSCQGPCSDPGVYDPFEGLPFPAFEWCDGADLRGLTCADFNFRGGTLACRNDCEFNFAGCVPTLCGDGVVEGLEVCESTSTCAELFPARPNGTLTCASDCYEITADNCVP